MAASVPVLVQGAQIASGVATVAGFFNSKDQRKDAEKQAAQTRDALASLKKEPEPTMPSADDAATKAARSRSIAEQIRRRGRASTILTGSSGPDSLGAGA